ncbi:MAG: PhnD/SsuA/transferrin family substrate-binding protein [Geminicoccaceae bacterium]|nr:PhnD/SsuA/transferrin family substrate-binding protein [Geminicoccaceae bacterium]
MTVALPMYDLPELRPWTDRWWQGVRAALRRHGFAGLPPGLERPGDLHRFWMRDDLVLSQCCGHDFVHRLRGRVAVVATPDYDAPGCGGGRYRSFLVTRAGEARDLSALRRGRLAVNGTGSHSGWTALRHLLRGLGGAAPLYWRVRLTGSHRASLKAVRDGEGDVAAIDAVTLALILDVAPGEMAGLAVAAAGAAAPALPYVTGGARLPAERRAMFEALSEAAADPALEEARRHLRLRGFVGPAGVDYGRILAMENETWGRRRACAPAGASL